MVLDEIPEGYELVITGEADVVPGPDRAANLAAAGLPPDEPEDEEQEQ
jgi:hypothetical protein